MIRARLKLTDERSFSGLAGSGRSNIGGSLGFDRSLLEVPRRKGVLGLDDIVRYLGLGGVALDRCGVSCCLSGGI